MKLLSIALAAALAIGALAQGQPKRGNVPVKGGRKLALGRSNACAKICAAKKRSRNGGKQLRNKRGGKNKQPKKRAGKKISRKNPGKRRAKQMARHPETHVPVEPAYVYPTYAPTYEPEEYVPEDYVPEQYVPGEYVPSTTPPSVAQECQPLSEQFKFYLKDKEVADKLGITTQDAAALMAQGKTYRKDETGSFQASDGTSISYQKKNESIIVKEICINGDSGAAYPTDDYVYYDYYTTGVRRVKKGAKTGGKKQRTRNPKGGKLRRNRKTPNNKRPKTRRGPKAKGQGKVQRAGRRQAPKCRC